MTDITRAVPTGRFAISAGTAIILGVQLEEGDLDIGKGVMYQLDKWNLSAAGTYDFTYGGQHYAGTWFTTVVSTDGQTWVLSETITGTIDITRSFPAIARPSGHGPEAKITFIGPEPPDDVQSFQNDAPGQKAMIKYRGPLPVFGFSTAYYYNAAYLG